MYLLKFVIVFIIYGVCEGCNEYCSCAIDVTECYLPESCAIEDIPVSETYVLHLHGTLCPLHREELAKPIFHNTIKILHNDFCEELFNCR